MCRTIASLTQQINLQALKRTCTSPWALSKCSNPGVKINVYMSVNSQPAYFPGSLELPFCLEAAVFDAVKVDFVFKPLDGVILL